MNGVVQELPSGWCETALKTLATSTLPGICFTKYVTWLAGQNICADFRCSMPHGMQNLQLAVRRSKRAQLHAQGPGRVPLGNIFDVLLLVQVELSTNRS